MKIRAAICDVYRTLLQVSPPPSDIEERWAALCFEVFRKRAPFSLNEFHARSEKITAREQDAARAMGIAHPEVLWPCAVSEALPGFSDLKLKDQKEFLFRHASLRHSVRLMPGAAEVLRIFSQQGIVLGIASNAQQYTLRELDDALGAEGLSRNLFTPELTFWSFEHGFGKPDPHVFRLLSVRLRKQGIAPDEVLMIGDRQENDIAPAKAQGWRAWQIAPDCTPGESGDWFALNGQIGR